VITVFAASSSPNPIGCAKLTSAKTCLTLWSGQNHIKEPYQLVSTYIIVEKQKLTTTVESYHNLQNPFASTIFMDWHTIQPTSLLKILNLADSQLFFLMFSWVCLEKCLLPWYYKLNDL
jgi:hypothetical protein